MRSTDPRATNPESGSWLEGTIAEAIEDLAKRATVARRVRALTKQALGLEDLQAAGGQALDAAKDYGGRALGWLNESGQQPLRMGLLGMGAGGLLGGLSSVAQDKEERTPVHNALTGAMAGGALGLGGGLLAQHLPGLMGGNPELEAVQEKIKGLEGQAARGKPTLTGALTRAGLYAAPLEAYERFRPEALRRGARLAMKEHADAYTGLRPLTPGGMVPPEPGTAPTAPGKAPTPPAPLDALAPPSSKMPGKIPGIPKNPSALPPNASYADRLAEWNAQLPEAEAAARDMAEAARRFNQNSPEYRTAALNWGAKRQHYEELRRLYEDELNKHQADVASYSGRQRAWQAGADDYARAKGLAETRKATMNTLRAENSFGGGAIEQAMREASLLRSPVGPQPANLPAGGGRALPWYRRLRNPLNFANQGQENSVLRGLTNREVRGLRGLGGSFAARQGISLWHPRMAGLLGLLPYLKSQLDNG